MATAAITVAPEAVRCCRGGSVAGAGGIGSDDIAARLGTSSVRVDVEVVGWHMERLADCTNQRLMWLALAIHGLGRFPAILDRCPAWFICSVG